MQDPQSVLSPDKPNTAPEGAQASDTEDAYLKEEDPRPHEPWQVEDDEAQVCIPSKGFIHEYMQYCPTTCDGAYWFQLGGVLTMLSVVAGNCDYRLMASNGRYEEDGLHLWSANIGYTGTRKSQSIKPALRILRNVNRKLILATDGSLEAYHDTLADRDHQGVGLMHRDEMSTLFAQAKRSYSTGLTGWMIEAYSGGPTERRTVSGGAVEIERVRLSVLGNIPPTTLQQNTSREDWRTGFLPRFCFWGARRRRYMPVAPGDLQVEGVLSDWLKTFLANKSIPVVIPEKVGRILTDWHRREVESKSGHYPDELCSVLQRLRAKGCQFTSLIALSKLEHIVKEGTGVLATEEDVLLALEIIKLHKRSTIALFSYVGATEEATQEQLALQHIATTARATTSTVAAALGISIKTAVGICQVLGSQGLIDRVSEKTGGRGRPRFHLVIP